MRLILTTGEITSDQGRYHGDGVDKLVQLHTSLRQPGFYLTGDVFSDVKKMIRTNYSRVGSLKQSGNAMV